MLQNNNIMRIQFLLLLALFTSTAVLDAQTQQIQYEMKLLRVYQNYPHNDGGGPDITWKARAILNGFGPSPIAGPTAEVHLPDMQSMGWFDAGAQTIASGTMTYTAGNTFNLCSDNITVNIELEAWEDDCDNVFEFSQICDDHQFGANANGVGNPKNNEGSGVTRVFELINFPPNNFQNPYYGFEVSITYTLTNGIREVIYAGDINGGPVADVCEGGSYYLFARTEPGFSGGNFEFQRSDNNGSSWATVQTGNSSTYQVTASADPNVLYRVRLRGGFGCLGYANDDGWVAPAGAGNLRIIPTFGAADINYSVLSSCDGPATSSITVSSIDNLPPGSLVNMQLNSPNDPFFVTPNIGFVSLPYTWGNLEAGSYTINVTNVQINGDDLPTGQCTQDLSVEIPPVTLPVFTSVTTTNPGCGETVGSVNISINTFTSAFSYSWEVFSVGNTTTPVATSNAQSSSLQFSNLLPGDYFVRLTINGTCVVDSDQFTIAPPLAIAGGSAQVFYPGGSTTVLCPDGKATVELSTDAGTGQNTVKVYFSNALNKILASGSASPGIPFSTLLTPGNYTAVFQRDDNGCQAFVDFTVANPNNVLAVAVQATQTPPPCTPLGGSLTLNVTGGASPYTFIINGVSRTPTSISGSNYFFNALPTGTGYYEVTDGNGCTAKARYSIAVNTFPNLSVTISVDPEPWILTCNGGNDGWLAFYADGPIIFDFDGNALGYQYKIDELDTDYGPVIDLDPNNLNRAEVSRTGLSPGAYTIYTKDANGCEVARVAYIEEFVPEMEITRVEIDPTYCDNPFINVTIYATGFLFRNIASNPPQIFLSQDPITPSFFGSGWIADPNDPNGIIVNRTLQAGNYNFQLRQFKGPNYEINGQNMNYESYCFSNVFPITTADFNVAAPLAVTTQVSSPTCPGETNGSLTVNFTGGEPGYELQLVQFSSQFSLSNPTILETVLLNGNPPGSYTFTGLDAGYYGVQVRTALIDGGATNLPGSCTRYFPGNWTTGQFFTPFTLTDPTTMSIFSINTSVPLQCDLTGGQIFIPSVTGGTPPYQYSINGVDFSTSNVLPAVSQNTVYVRDANSCQVTQSYTVTDIILSDLTVSFAATPPANCILQGLGTFTINPGTQGTPPYRIEYSSSMSGGQLVNPVIIQTSNLSLPVSGLTPGDLFVKITDAAQCAKSFTFTVDNVSSSPLSAATTSKTQQSCPDINNGALTVTAQGGIPPYQISYNGVSTTGATRSLSNLGPGSYLFDITDGAGCTYTHEESIEAATVIRHDQTYTTVGPCADSGNGSVTITPQGGLAPYTISWEDGTPDQIAGAGESITRNNLEKEEYTFTITGVGGCFLVSSIYPPGPEVLFEAALGTVMQPQCAGVDDGSVTIQATGGTGPYTYSSDGGITFQNSATFSDLGAGTYNFIARDDIGCERTINNVQINNTEAVSAGITTVPVPCFGENSGSITVTPSGGTGPYTLSVNGSAPSTNLTASNLTGDTYSVVVSDANGCLFSDPTVVVTQPDALDLVATPVPPACNGNTGSISLSASGGTGAYEYRLVGGTYSNDNTLSNLLAGSYDVQVRDANGCETTVLNVEVIQPPLIDIQLLSTTPDYCNRADGTATVSATGGTGTLTFTWSNGDTGPTATDLSAGDVTVTVTDQNNCINTLVVNIVAVPFPTITGIAIQDAICTNDNGTAELSFTGGTGTITIEWSNGAMGANISGLSFGDYTVTLTDGVGCSVIQTATVGFLPAHTLTTIQSDENCDQSNGSITVNTSGGSGDFTFAWPAGVVATGNTAENLSGGTYVITVTDNIQGCVVSTSVTLDNTPELMVTFDVNDVLCNGDVNGSIIAIPATGTSPYTISLNGGTPIAGLTVSGLAAGTYSVTVSDINGCSFTDPAVEVGEPNVLTLDATPIAPLCFGGNNGSISLSASGGVGSYEYRLLGGTYSNNSIISNLSTGTYSVQVRDANGCETTLNNVVITQPSAIVFQLDGTTPEFCGRADGTATVSASGGTGNLSFSWSNGQSGPTANGLSVGTYSVTVTDANNCMADIQNINITETPPVTLGIAELLHSLCDEGNGQITVSVTDAPGPFTYNWSHDAGLNSPIASGLNSGDYFLTVTDGNNCSAEISATVLLRPRPVLGTPVVTLAACMGNTGSMQVSVESGGTEPFTYSWSHDPGLNAALATDLGTGSYTCTVTDFYGCTDEVTAFVGELPPPQATVDVTTATCTLPNGSAEVSVTGGTSPYQYTWSNGAPDSPIAQNLAEGDYTVTVTDFYGCQDIQMFSVGNIPGPTDLIVNFQNSTCTNGTGSITVVPQGGTPPFDYDWSHNAFLNQPTAQLLVAGTYSVTATDDNGCVISATQVIEFQPPAVITTIELKNSFCTNGNGRIEIAVAGNGPFSYTWTNGVSNGPVAETLTVGNYTVTVTDVNGCTTIQTFNIALEPAPALQLQEINDDICAQSVGSIRVTAFGGAQPLLYSWSHDPDLNSNLATGLSSGTYGLTLTDANGCSTTGQYVVDEIPGPSGIDVTFQNSVCNNSNGSINVVPQGGTAAYSYSWSHRPSWNRDYDTDLPAGDYSVTVTDANGCTITATQTILELPPADIQTVQQINSQCVDGNGLIEISATGSDPFTYTWTNGVSTGPIANNLNAGDYTVTVTDVNGCTSTQSFTILLESVPVIESIQIVDDACGQAIGSIQIVVISDAQPIIYNWSHDPDLNSNAATGLTEGTYGVTLTDSNGCSVSAQYIVGAESEPSLTIQNVENDICGDTVGAVTVQVQGGLSPFSFSWEHDPDLNGPSATNLSAGTYRITVTDASNCTGSLEVDVTGTEPPTLSLIETNEDPCEINDVSITIGLDGDFPPYTFSWSHDTALNSLVATGLASGTYTITATDADGCAATFTTTVIDQRGPEIALVSTINSTCGQMDGSATVMASFGQLPYTYSWSHNLALNSPEATNLAAGAYSVSVTDANGCTAQISFNISDTGGPTVVVTDNQDAICTPDNGSMSVEASNGQAPYSFSWSHDLGLNSSTATDLAPGTYNITVTDANDCKAIISATVGFQAPPVINSLVTPAICVPNSGSILVAVINGTEPYQISWNTAALEGFNPTQVTAGTYTATVTDGNNCSSTAQITVDFVPGPTLNTAEISHPSCEEENGSISVSAFGGASPYTYNWSHDPSISTPTATGLAAGDYTVTVTDNNGCQDEVFIAIENIPLVSVDAEVTNAGCNQNTGSISLVLMNGAYPLSFSWDHDANLDGPIATGLGIGSYRVTVTEAAGCQQIATFTISEEDGVGASIVSFTNPSCESDTGEISISATGGQAPYQFAWSHDPSLNAAIATGLAAGPYSITVTDVNGCQDILETTLIPTDNLNISVSTIPQSCTGLNDGQATVSSLNPGPFTYEWNTPVGSTTNSVSNLPPGNYMVTVVDQDGCSSVNDFIIEPALPIELTTSFTPSCLNELNGTATAVATGGAGGFTYLWSGMQEESSVTGLEPGIFSVTVTDANACSSSAVIVVPAAPFPTVSVIETTEPDCAIENSGAIEVVATGGVGSINYQWDDPQNQMGPLATSLNPGTYTVIATDENGCSSFLSIDLATLPNFILSVATTADPACFDDATGTAVAVVQGGSGNFTYQWSDPLAQSTPQATNLVAGDYTVTITDLESGCIQIATTTLTEPSPIELAILDTTDALCFGQSTGSASIQASGGTGGYMYQWNDPALQSGSTASNLSAGTYSVIVTDTNGCEALLEINIDEPPMLSVEIETVTPPLCADQDNGLATVMATGGAGPYTYQWNDAAMQVSNTAINLVSGNYTVLITDANGCETTLPVLVPDTPPIEVIVAALTDPSCAGFDDGSLVVSSSGGTGTLSYLWDNGATDPMLSDLSAGDYTVSVTDANGCLALLSLTLTAPEEIVIETVDVVAPLCLNDATGLITVVASGGGGLPFTYIWSNGQEGPGISQITGGQTYQVTATNTANCSQELTIELPDGAEVDISAVPSAATICADDIFLLDLEDFSTVTVNGPGGFSETGSRVLLEAPGMYTIEIQNQVGCRDTVDFSLLITADLLVAGMVLPSDVVVNDSIVVLETSWPAPESVDWIYDESIATLVRQEQNQYWFVFSEPGRFQISMLARQGGCEDLITKEIVVHPDSTSIPSVYLGKLEIISAIVSPNPTNGPFQATVALSSPGTLFMSLYTATGELVDRQQGTGSASYTFDFNGQGQDGTYLLLVQTGQDRRTLTVIVKE